MYLLIDKPKGITSHDVVDEIREVTGEKKIGHAGTLDPNATGLLIIGISRESTKKLGKIAKDTKKTYEAEIFIGEGRDTDDTEGGTLRQAQDDKSGVEIVPNLSNIKKVLKEFVGEQMQMPPAYSAIKIKGKPAYKYARKGHKLKLKPRNIVVRSIKLLKYRYPVLTIETVVSSGTYIRALARDIGKRMGSRAYLRNLRRTQIGNYSVDSAVKLKDLTKLNWKIQAINI